MPGFLLRWGSLIHSPGFNIERMGEIMATEEEILEGARDLICRISRSDELDACESCEKLQLKPVCSIRHYADELLDYLRDKGWGRL